MTHEERRLICLIGRVTADLCEIWDDIGRGAETAKKLRKAIGMVQTNACKRDIAKAKAKAKRDAV